MKHLEVLKTHFQKLQNASTIIFIQRIWRLACTNFWRNKFLSLATIAVIALILFSFNIILTINTLSESIIEKFNKKVDIILYVKDDVDLLKIETLTSTLKKMPAVKSATYTSKETALENFLRQYENKENPFTEYGLKNTLPANIQIITASPSDHKSIIEYIKGSQYLTLFENIESDQESRTIAEKLIQITDITKKIMWGIISAFIIGGILIILNSLSLTIHARKKEIQIMRLVGANYHFIRLPFVIEGAMYGFLAVLTSIILLKIFIESVGLYDVQSKYTISINGMSHIFLYEVIMSIFIGIISSQIAIHRYFTEKS